MLIYLIKIFSFCYRNIKCGNNYYNNYYKSLHILELLENSLLQIFHTYMHASIL